MPAQYEAMKQSLINRGMPEKKAEGLAARTYNAHRKKGQKPVTGSDKK